MLLKEINHRFLLFFLSIVNLVFQVFRVYSNNQEMEMDRLKDTFSVVPNKSKVCM